MEKELKKVEKVEETKVEKTEIERKLKSFEIKAVQGSKGVYHKLVVKTFADKECQFYLAEDVNELVGVVGIENCFVDIATRKSKDDKNYKVIALNVGEYHYDFFPDKRNQAFIALAEISAKKHFVK